MTSVPVSKAFVFAAVPVGCSLMLVYELMRLVALVRSLKDR
jgi:TRAP-type C4-dicarboxylate transport system permease small subunit